MVADVVFAARLTPVVSLLVSGLAIAFGGLADFTEVGTMKISFESGALEDKVLFKEKHVYTVLQTIKIPDLVATTAKNTQLRTFVGSGVRVNSIMAMTVGQQESLFAYLMKYKMPELNKITKSSGMVEIDGIPVYGCIIADGKARASGTVKLGFVRKTGTQWSICHFGGHSWKGSMALGSTHAFNVK